MGDKAKLLSGPCIVTCDAIPAVLTTVQAANKDLTFKAKATNVSGNEITVAYVVAGVSTALSVVVTNSAIVVNTKTTAGVVADSTASEIKTAIEANSQANALVAVTLATGSDGTGKPAAMAATNLSGGALVDVGYTKGGVKLDISPKVKSFNVDQLGSTPVLRVIDGAEVKVSFSLAEYSLENLRLAILNAVPLADDTTPSKRRLDIRSLAGKAIQGRKWVIKQIDPATGLASTDKEKWLTIPNGAPSDSTVSIAYTIDELRLIPVAIECIPDATDTLLFFGDSTVVDADASGF